MRLAMWSGPRNLSTAMMYSFGARADCTVVDEPFYAAYLAATGIDHPMRDEIIAQGETDPAAVDASLSAPLPSGKTLFYQKHMTHHMLAAFPTRFYDAVTHVFLIRHPARVLASYAKVRPDVVLADIGFVEQIAIFKHVSETQKPLVIDSAAVRQNPEAALSGLCDGLGIPFDPSMLSWPAGGHAADGIWSKYWYGSLHASTGFSGAEGPLPEVPDHLTGVLAEAMPLYEEMTALTD